MDKVLLADMHTHSENSHDSTFPLEGRAKEAQANGIDIFAVTDHCSALVYEKHNLFEKIKKSHNDAEAASEKCKVKILKGVEVGEAYANIKSANHIAENLDHDVILASVHFMNYKDYKKPYSSFNFSEISSEDLDGFLRQYFKDIVTTINTFDFDVLAHLTCPERYIKRYRDDLNLIVYREEITEILKLIIEKNIALEINTQNEFIPGEWIIKLYKELGGFLVTLGSDSHTEGTMCKNFDKGIKLLRNCGFAGYYYFEKRKPIKILF